jgi:maltooligosyltrehalose trehalohydrolase
MKRHHRLPFGAEPDGDHVRFRLWAPAAEAVEVAIEGGSRFKMRAEEDGWFSLETREVRAGARYMYAIGGERYPDPASRYQPDGPLGPSEVIDAAAYDWTDGAWVGRPWEETVLYELHIGAFSRRGDFAGVEHHLDHLVGLGVTAIEIMPVAECPGRFNWGYDGVQPFAVETRYGGPNALKHLVEACHAKRISVILDVVYNHFGPEGNFLHAYASPFFTKKHKTPWGAAINFDDKGASNVRQFFIENALYWLEEYHLDGLRLDAVHAIQDDTRPDIVVELGERVRTAITDRPIHLILENDQNRASVLGFGAGGRGPHTAQWNDDFHHAMRVLIADAKGGYYVDYADNTARHLGRILAEGFAYQGETSAHRNRARRGEPSAALPPSAFIGFIQNHDQVGNHAYGWRLPKFAPREAIRAAAAVLLLNPQIPMLFMGEEWYAEQPFPFFCDFGPDLADAVRQGRIEEFSAFPEFRDETARAKIPDPCSAETFHSAILDWSVAERAENREWLGFYRELIRLRHERIVPRLKRAKGPAGAYMLIDERALDVRWQLAGGALLHMLVNLSAEPIEIAVQGAIGRQLYATGERAQGLPPWFVSVSLADPSLAE